jgi:hypothetical protein
MPTTWENLEKPGTLVGGWNYNELGMTYNQVFDVDTGLTVYYNGVGASATWTNQSPKPTTTYTNPSKVSSSWTNQAKI